MLASAGICSAFWTLGPLKRYLAWTPFEGTLQGVACGVPGMLHALLKDGPTLRVHVAMCGL